MDSPTTTEILDLGMTQLLVRKVLELFYEKAFTDLLISHFFMGRDKTDLIEKQFLFTVSLLGGPKNYTGKPLPVAHFPLQIRKPHFMRRKVLMHECMIEAGLTEPQATYWLAKEEELKKFILRAAKTAK